MWCFLKRRDMLLVARDAIRRAVVVLVLCNSPLLVLSWRTAPAVVLFITHTAPLRYGVLTLWTRVISLSEPFG
jgi:hypothetical protein